MRIRVVPPVALLGALLVVASSAWFARTSSDERLPYRAALDSRFVLPLASTEAGAWNSTYVLLDCDGDGLRDLVVSGSRSVRSTSLSNGSRRTPFDLYPSPGFALADPAFELVLMDWDGDGSDEIIVGGRDEDSEHFGFWILDPRAARLDPAFTLAAVPGRWNDGKWDGIYSPIGMIEVPTPDGDTPALLIACTVGWDIEGRGLLAVDPQSGETLWRFVSGSAIDYRLVRLLDLNDDGHLDIIAGAVAPDNLFGASINGFDDRHSRLMAFSRSGEVLWTQDLYEHVAYLSLETADLDGDSRLEIVTSASRDSIPESRLSVWSRQGQLLAEYRDPASSYRFVSIADDPKGLIATNTGENDIGTFALEAGELRPQKSFHASYPLKLCRFLDVLPDRDGQELVLSSVAGPMTVLSNELKLLAVAPDDPGATHRSVEVWEPSPGERFLLRQRHFGHRGSAVKLRFVPWPERHWRELTAGAALAAGGGLAGLALLRRRRRAAVTPDALVRMRRRELLRRLEVTYHGELGSLTALRTLRRMSWYLEALTDPGAANRDALLKHTLEKLREYRRGPAVDLRDALQLAQAASIEPTLVERARMALDALEGALRSIPISEIAPAQASQCYCDLQESQRETEAAFARLRRSLEAQLSCSPGEVWKKVLEQHRGRIATDGVRVEASGMDDAPYCQIDADDLAFVLENLTSNALRAMSDAAKRTLGIQAWSKHGMLYLRIEDTGSGIPPEDQEEALSTRFTTKPDGEGGLGLPESKRILASVHGQLRIVESQPGKGTTFEISIPLSLDSASGASP